jgi:hypothetical protein
VLVVAPGPRLDAQLFEIVQITPAQLPRHHGVTDTGARALGTGW